MKAKLQHNLSRELEKNEKQIRRVLEADIIAAYYYQKGVIAYQNGYDRQIQEAKRLVMSDDYGGQATCYVGRLSEEYNEIRYRKNIDGFTST